MLCCFLLHNNVNQPLLYMYPLPLEPPFLHPIPPPQVITEHRAELSVLYSIFPPLTVNTSQCYFLHLPHPHPPPACPQLCSLHLHLHSFPANRFVSIILTILYFKIMNGNEELMGEKNHFTDAGLMLSCMVKNALKPQCTSSVSTTCDHLNGGEKKRGTAGSQEGPLHRLDARDS